MRKREKLRRTLKVYLDKCGFINCGQELCRRENWIVSAQGKERKREKEEPQICLGKCSKLKALEMQRRPSHGSLMPF